MSVAELCRRLPSGATVGIGRMSRRLDCSRDALTRVPAQADLNRFDKHSHVRPADATEWGLPQSVPGLDKLRLFTVVDMPASLTAWLVVARHTDPAAVKAVMRACSDHQVAVPLQVWEAGKLPAWLLRAIESPGRAEA